MTDWWHNRPWRLIQTNLREIDMRDIRAAQVVSDLRAFHANILMINAAGIIASYPTRLPFQFQSQYLTGDSLTDIIAACHAADIRVIARTDFSKVRRPIYEQHPDWAYISPQGRIVDYNGDVHVCINGPYQQVYALQIIEELLSTHEFDGIFFNMGGYQTRDYSGNYYGICHCAQCCSGFRAFSGRDLPDHEDMGDPVYRRYAEFKRQTAHAQAQRVYEFIAGCWPHLCIANHGEFGRGFIRQESNTALDRPLPHWQYSASDNTKWATGSYPELVSSNTSVDFIDFPYRHAAVSPHQQTLRLAQSLANGGALDYYLIGRLDNHEDRSGFAGIQDMYAYHAAHEREYRDLTSRAEIALLKSGQNEAEYRGWFRVLAENHYLFDVLTLDAAERRLAGRYRAVVVPGIEAMNDALAQRLDAFVRDGGTLVATGQCGFLDGQGESRPSPALACLGIQKVLTVRDDMRSSYFKIDPPPAGFETLAQTAALVVLDGSYVYAQYALQAVQHLRLIPPHPFGPPERCTYEQVTDQPGFVVHPYGQGRAAWAPFQPGALFHRQGHTNSAEFCAGLLRHCGVPAPIRGNLPPQVEVTLYEQDGGAGLLLHLVNASGHFGNTFYAPLTLADIEVSLPCPREPLAVRALRSASTPAYTWDRGRLTLRLPRLELFQAVYIAL